MFRDALTDFPFSNLDGDLNKTLIINIYKEETKSFLSLFHKYISLELDFLKRTARKPFASVSKGQKWKKGNIVLEANERRDGRLSNILK